MGADVPQGLPAQTWRCDNLREGDPAGRTNRTRHPAEPSSRRPGL